MPERICFRKKGINKALLVQKLNEIRNVSDGRVSFDGVQLHLIVPMISSAMGVGSGRHLDNHTRKMMIRNALFSPNLQAGFNVTDFEKECNRQYSIHSQKQLSKYTIVFQLPILDFGRKHTKYEQILVDSSGDIRSHFFQRALEERKNLHQTARYRLNLPNVNETMLNVKVIVSAATPMEAYYLAAETFDELRGAMNLLFNYQRHWRFSLGTSAPEAINWIRRGLISTVHREDGRLASETFWYERDWLEPKNFVEFGDDKSAQFDWILRKLRRTHALMPYAKLCLLQYCRALDLSEFKYTFLELWSILELLTLSERENYDKLVDRSAAMHDEFDWMREVGRHLLYRRNAIIHTLSQEDGELETIVYQYKRLVEPLLRFYLINPYNMQSQEEVIRFLDFGKNPDALSRFQPVVAAAKKFFEVA